MERYHAVILLFVFAGLFRFHFLLAEKMEQSDCVDSGLVSPNGNKIYSPKDCRPTKCEVTGPTEGLNCSIGNYINNFPDACKDINAYLQTRAWQPMPPVDQVCQPLLSSINLYELHCRQIDVREVALNFTFQLPLCGAEATPSKAVKVDFNANWKREGNHFARYPICRVFNYSGSDFSSLSSFPAPIELWYKCQAIGLQDNYPEVYYYLSFTAYPSGAQLNYTIVFLDVDSGSMQLLAGAWRSRRVAHFVFLPINGINNYLIEAKSGRWKHSLEVSVPTVEISKIPNSSNIVTVTVTPNDRDACIRLGFQCSSATVTLHDKNTLILPAEPPDPEESAGVDWGHVTVVVLGSLVTLGLITATVSLCLHYRRRKQAKSRGDTFPLPQGRQYVVCITHTFATDTYGCVEDFLRRHNFDMDALKPNGVSIIRMRDCSFILIILCDSFLTASSDRNDFLKLIGLLFENKPLWNKVRVAAIAAKGQSCLTPSSILQNSIKNHLHKTEFLTVLDQNTYDMPQHRERLISSMQQIFEVETESVSHEEEIPILNPEDQCRREILQDTSRDQLLVNVHLHAVSERARDSDTESDGAISTSDPWVLPDDVAEVGHHHGQAQETFHQEVQDLVHGPGFIQEQASNPVPGQVQDDVLGLILDPVPEQLQGNILEQVSDHVHHDPEHILGQVQYDLLGQILVPVHGQAQDHVLREVVKGQGEEPFHEQIAVPAHEQTTGPVRGQVSSLHYNGQNISCNTEREPEISKHALQPRPPPEGCDSEETFRKEPLGQTGGLPHVGEEAHREEFEEETLRKTINMSDHHQQLSNVNSDDEGNNDSRNSFLAEEGWVANTSLFSQDGTSSGRSSTGGPILVPEMQNVSSPSQTTPPSNQFERKPICQLEAKSEPHQFTPIARQGPRGIFNDYESVHLNSTPQGEEKQFFEPALAESGTGCREPGEDSYHSSFSHKWNSLPHAEKLVCGPEHFCPSQRLQSNGWGMDGSMGVFESDFSKHQPFDEMENGASEQAAAGADFVPKGPPPLMVSQMFHENNKSHELDRSLLARGPCEPDVAGARPWYHLNSIEDPLLLRENENDLPGLAELRQFAEQIIHAPQSNDGRLLNGFRPERRDNQQERRLAAQHGEDCHEDYQERRHAVQHGEDSDENGEDSGFVRDDLDSIE